MIDSNMIGKVVSFEIYGSNIIGTDYSRCKILGLLDVDSAKHYIDPQPLSIAIYPQLPEGTPKEYRNYIYVKVQLINGETACVANEWIKQDTLKVHEDIQAVFTINRINAEDVTRIRNILLSYNYTDISSVIK